MKPALGIALKVLSALAFTLMSAGIKRVTANGANMYWLPTGSNLFSDVFVALKTLLDLCGTDSLGRTPPT